MRSFLKISGCLLILGTITATTASTQIDIKHWQTKNGADVYFVYLPQLSIVDVQLAFTAGSAYDGNKWGLASLVNSLVGEETSSHDANQISASFDSVGAQFNQSTDQDMSLIRLRTLTIPKYLNPAIEMFAETINQFSISPTVLQRVKQQTIANIHMEEQSPATVASNAFFQQIYAAHPYAHPVDGTVESVQSVSKEEVDAFYRRFYVAKNAKLVMVGDLSASAASTLAEQIVGKLPAGEAAPKMDAAKDLPNAAYHFMNFPSKQDTIILGQVGVTPQDSNRFALAVGNETLGGAPLSSLLFNEVRNQRGLAYNVSSEFSPLQYGGPFYIQLQTRTDQAKTAIQIVQQTLTRFLQQGPTEAELNDAKKNLIGSFPLRVASNANISQDVTMIAFYGLPLDYLNTYTQKIGAIDASQVKTAFQDTVHVNALKTIVVGGENPFSSETMAHKTDGQRH